jgi:hypothetical protein
MREKIYCGGCGIEIKQGVLCADCWNKNTFKVEELKKIQNAIDMFSDLMLGRMQEKMLEGHTCWDDREKTPDSYFIERMRGKMKDFPLNNDLFDIANFAMILMYRRIINNENVDG